MDSSISLSISLLSSFSLILFRRRLRTHRTLSPAISASRRLSLRPISTDPLPSSPDPKPPNLSSRLAFVFDQIDAIDRDRSSKDAALQRIRAWRQTHPPPPPPPPPAAVDEVATQGEEGVLKKEVELVHPWPEWIELMERLASQKYFDHKRVNEDLVAQNVNIDLTGIKDDTEFNFSTNWTTVRTACINFGRDRFDILRSLSRNDIQVLVGHGCPSMDSKVVFSAKLLRKYVHLDEGDVCSSCSLRNSCGRGYILTHKEDEARTLDIMRILLTFGLDPVIGSVENKPLMKLKSVKAVVRKLLHQVVKLSAVPIDPNLPPPVIKKPPPKVKQPPPPPKKRVGRDDVEMKKGDWLCPKCDFMNFAKNLVCLQCDVKRPKRQLLPGEWECPQCNFLNYRRNMECFHCEHKRPPDEFTEDRMQANQPGPRTRFERASKLSEVPNAWNFNFDENESDGADVAAFEFADHPKMAYGSPLDNMDRGRIARGFDDDDSDTRKIPKTHERRRYFSEHDERKSTVDSHRTGFDDFDDEEDDVDSYELDAPNSNREPEVRRASFSEVDQTSDSEDSNDFDSFKESNRGTKYSASGSEDDDWKSNNDADFRRKAGNKSGPYSRRGIPSDEDIELDSDSDDDGFGSKSKQRRNGLQTGQRRIGHKVNFDSDAELFHGSGSDDDDDDLHPSGRMRDNKAPSGRRVDGRDSFGKGRGEHPSRGSHGFNRSSRGDGDTGRRESGRFQQNDRVDGFEGSGFRQRGKASQYGDRSRGSRRNERGSFNGGYSGGPSSSGYGGRGGVGGRFGRRGSDFMQEERGSNRFIDRSRSFYDDRDGGVGGRFNRRGSDFRQEGRGSNRFTDRSRSFDDDRDDDRRPRRRIIER